MRSWCINLFREIHLINLASGGVTCKLVVLRFCSSSVLVDNFVLRNLPKRKARKCMRHLTRNKINYENASFLINYILCPEINYAIGGNGFRSTAVYLSVFYCLFLVSMIFQFIVSFGSPTKLWLFAAVFFTNKFQLRV